MDGAGEGCWAAPEAPRPAPRRPAPSGARAGPRGAPRPPRRRGEGDGYGGETGSSTTDDDGGAGGEEGDEDEEEEEGSSGDVRARPLAAGQWSPPRRREEESEAASHRAEMEQIQQVWRRTKRELTRKRELLRQAGDEEEARRRDLDSQAAVFDDAARQLRHTLHSHAEKLRDYRARCRAQREELAASAEEARGLRRARDAAARDAGAARAEADAQAEHARHLAAEVERLLEAQRRWRANDAAQQQEQAAALAAREREVAEQRGRIEGLDRLVGEMRGQAAAHGRDIAQLRQLVEEEAATSAELRSQLAAARAAADEARELRVRLGEGDEEREQLRGSNARLLSLLNRHGELLAPGLTHLAPTSPPPGRGTSPPRQRAVEDRPVLPQRETDYWIPAEAFRIMSAFKARYFPTSAAAPFHDVLVAVNKVWKAKEVKTHESLERRHRKQLREQRERQRRVAGPAHALLGDGAQDAAALRRELLRHRARGDAYVTASQHTKVLETAVHTVDTLLGRTAQLEADAAALRDGAAAQARESALASERAWGDARREAARRCWELGDQAAGRILALCADSLRCLAVPSAELRVAGPLRAIVDIQRDFAARVQREVGELRDAIGAARPPPGPAA